MNEWTEPLNSSVCSHSRNASNFGMQPFFTGIPEIQKKVWKFSTISFSLQRSGQVWPELCYMIVPALTCSWEDTELHTPLQEMAGDFRSECPSLIRSSQSWAAAMKMHHLEDDPLHVTPHICRDLLELSREERKKRTGLRAPQSQHGKDHWLCRSHRQWQDAQWHCRKSGGEALKWGMCGGLLTNLGNFHPLKAASTRWKVCLTQPKQLTGDGRPQFEAPILKNVMKVNGTCHIKLAP